MAVLRTGQVSDWVATLKVKSLEFVVHVFMIDGMHANPFHVE